MKRKLVVESLLSSLFSPLLSALFGWAAAIQIFVMLYTQFGMFDEMERRWGNHEGEGVTEVTLR